MRYFVGGGDSLFELLREGARLVVVFGYNRLRRHG